MRIGRIEDVTPVPTDSTRRKVRLPDSSTRSFLIPYREVAVVAACKNICTQYTVHFTLYCNTNVADRHASVLYRPVVVHLWIE